MEHQQQEWVSSPNSTSRVKLQSSTDPALLPLRTHPRTAALRHAELCAPTLQPRSPYVKHPALLTKTPRWQRNKKPFHLPLDPREHFCAAPHPQAEPNGVVEPCRTQPAPNHAAFGQGKGMFCRQRGAPPRDKQLSLPLVIESSTSPPLQRRLLCLFWQEALKGLGKNAMQRKIFLAPEESFSLPHSIHPPAQLRAAPGLCLSCESHEHAAGGLSPELSSGLGCGS